MGDRRHFDPKAVRKALERERDELLAVRESSADDRRPVELDQQSVGRLSRMGAMQVQAMAQAVEVRRQGRLQRIEAALQLADAGHEVVLVEKEPSIGGIMAQLDKTYPTMDCSI